VYEECLKSRSRSAGLHGGLLQHPSMPKAYQGTSHTYPPLRSCQGMSKRSLVRSRSSGMGGVVGVGVGVLVRVVASCGAAAIAIVPRYENRLID
jgi:hypothetical protein